MNKLSRELAGKANFGHIENGKVVFDPRLTKYTELLVAECIKMCEEQSVFLLRFSQYGSNAAADCADIIKQEFGEDDESK